MTEAEKQAFAIYEEMCVTSHNRPFSANSVEELHRSLTAWSTANPGLAKLRQASEDVRLAFLKQSFGFLRAEAKDLENFRVIGIIDEGIQSVIFGSVKPLPTEIVHQLLSEYRQDVSMARGYFPLKEFLATIVKEQITDEIRAELRRLYVQYAPSPTGKINEHILALRERLAHLMRVEG